MKAFTVMYHTGQDDYTEDGVIATFESEEKAVDFVQFLKTIPIQARTWDSKGWQIPESINFELNRTNWSITLLYGKLGFSIQDAYLNPTWGK